MKKKQPKIGFDRTPMDYLIEGVIISVMIITAVLLCIYFDDVEQKHEDILNKYDSITAKLPKEEKIVNFNDVPKRKYYDKFGILNVEY
jgi:hypothetical protein